MSSNETMRRPFGVTLVMVVIAIAAVLNLVLGTMLVFSILGLLYLWLIKMTAIGSATAQVIIQMLSVINIVFAIFNLPYGWYTILLSTIILLLVSSARATMWFRQTN